MSKQKSFDISFKPKANWVCGEKIKDGSCKGVWRGCKANIGLGQSETRLLTMNKKKKWKKKSKSSKKQLCSEGCKILDAGPLASRRLSQSDNLGQCFPNCEVIAHSLASHQVSEGMWLILIIQKKSILTHNIDKQTPLLKRTLLCLEARAKFS